MDRRRVEEEVLTELASHPTVAYIRGLEDECEGYREALAVRALQPSVVLASCTIYTALRTASMHIYN